jgi:signal transduction histidine kinase
LGGSQEPSVETKRFEVNQEAIANLKQRVEQLERRWWKLSVYAGSAALALVIVLGLAWTDIPRRAYDKAREALPIRAVEAAEEEAKRSAEDAAASATAAKASENSAAEAAEATHRLPRRVAVLEAARRGFEPLRVDLGELPVGPSSELSYGYRMGSRQTLWKFWFL